MIITNNTQIFELPMNSKIYVCESPKIEVLHNVFEYSHQAKFTKYSPLLEFFKDSDGRIISINSTHVDFLEVKQTLDRYDDYYTHDFMVSDDKDELLKMFSDALEELQATLQRCIEMCGRIKDDYHSAEYVRTSQEENPDKWI